jgi:hypothetical protein
MEGPTHSLRIYFAGHTVILRITETAGKDIVKRFRDAKMHKRLDAALIDPLADTCFDLFAAVGVQCVKEPGDKGGDV